jgi:hypothetical protein
MYSPSQRVQAKANFLRFGTVEAHIGDDIYVVWDTAQEAVKVTTGDIEPVSLDDERKAKEGTMRLLKAIKG